jgi:phytoene dehydrogenase-like protein
VAKSIIIIGAGVAGLSAGCYAQMNGYDTRIFELHDKPGGLCTSWVRKGYTFDGCIHWLVGSKPGSRMNRIWQELGATQGRQMVDHEEFLRIVEPDGKTFILYTNVDRLEQHMRALAPVDAKVIGEFCGAIRRFTQMGEAGDGRRGLPAKIRSWINMLSLIRTQIKYSRVTVQDFAARFSDPFLHRAFAEAFYLPDLPMIALVVTLAWMHMGDAGYPIGGSLEFARAIECRYLDLGGEVHYRSRVSRILVENDRAVGVRLADGTEHRADVVISAADGHATIFDMLEGAYANDTVRGYYEELPIFEPIVQVSLGVARDLSGEPHSTVYQLDRPVTIAGEERKCISIRHYGYDPTMAPAGKSVIETMFPSSYGYWSKLYGDREHYEAEKQDIAIKVIDHLERHYPGISREVEAVDVATPMTYERYTGNWQGSMEGWLPTTKTMRMREGMDKTLPGLDSFYMVGQWVQPGGGLPPAATSARGVIETICRKDARAFTTSVPDDLAAEPAFDPME